MEVLYETRNIIVVVFTHDQSETDGFIIEVHARVDMIKHGRSKESANLVSLSSPVITFLSGPLQQIVLTGPWHSLEKQLMFRAIIAPL